MDWIDRLASSNFRIGCPVLPPMLNRSWARAASRFPLLALHNDLLELVILELPSGADVKALSHTCHALHALVVNGSLTLAAAWLWRQHGERALLKAQQQQDVPMLKQLVEVHHADVNCSNHPLLLLASRDGQLRVVQFLLTVPGLQVNQKDAIGATALHTACSRGRVSVVQELLKHPPINANEVNLWGTTALHWAVYTDQLEAARALLGHPGVDVHLKDLNGETALAAAQACGYAEMAALLTGHVEASSHATPAGSA